jgi:hypothetical protein
MESPPSDAKVLGRREKKLLGFMQDVFLNGPATWGWGRQISHPAYGIARWPEYRLVAVVEELP